MRNVLCYYQRSEESFFRLEGLPNSHLGEAERWVRQNDSKSSIGGFTFVLEGLPFVQGGLTLQFNKNPLIYNVSYFNLGDLKLRLGG